MAELTPIRQQKVYEAAMNQIVSLLEDGTFTPGVRLPTERALPEQLGISRASVRQALTGLTAMGLVESRPGDGTYVTERRTDFTWRVDAASALEILEGRRAIESGTVRLAAQRRDQRDLAILREIVDTMDEQVADGIHPVDTDREFHRAIAAAARNPLLLQAIDALLARMSGPEWHRIKLRGLRATGQTVRIQSQHRLIFAAIESGDAELAERLMKERLDRVLDDVRTAEHNKRDGR